MNTFIVDTSLTAHLQMGAEVVQSQSEDKNKSSQGHRCIYNQHFGYMYWLKECNLG